MNPLTVRKIGNSLGVILPKDALNKLAVQEGDRIFVQETPDGLELTTYDPEFEQAMAAYRQVNQKYRNALRELAK
jgi:putative addiction module antidote